MASLLYQTIEQISREKHIEPEIIVAAIEDAMVVAARKYYRTEEDLRSKFNPDTGQIDVYSVQTVVEEVSDPLREISLTEARKQLPSAEVGSRDHSEQSLPMCSAASLRRLPSKLSCRRCARRNAILSTTNSIRASASWSTAS